ncbi:hypothetical protein OAC78_07520 [Litorivicinus sp.]|nr:hypothetical protein [Litorivicinus sp.]
MTLILSNEDITSVLSIKDCIDDLEAAYLDLDQGIAVTRQRSDTLVPSGDRIYGLKTMDGIAPSAGVGAVRINSDIVTWPSVGDTIRRVKVPAAPNNRYTGLVLLFSIETGQPLAIMPDGVIQRMRVGATSAIGANLLANQGVQEVAVLGSGWQAGAQVLAICAARPEIQTVRCFSPNRDNCEAFVREMSDQVSARIIACRDSKEAIQGAGIVLCATNAIEPVFQEDWFETGMHIGSIKMSEITPDALTKADAVVMHLGHGAPLLTKAAGLEVPDHSQGRGWEMRDRYDFSECLTLPSLVAGREVPRKSPTDRTCFVNDLGLGLQFAVVAARCLKEAEKKGLGHELPTDWFTEKEHP